jgi:hypothetical protein
VVVLDYHCDYTYDPFCNSDGMGRVVDFYKIRGIPTAKIDGRRTCVGGSCNMFDCFLSAYDTEMQSSSACTLRVNVDYDSTTRDLKVKAWVTNLDGLSFPYLRYAIAESHIYYPWLGELDSLHHVVRKMLPDYQGVFFGVPPGETFVDSQSCTLDSNWNDRNCYVAVFVQSQYLPHQVYRSVKAPLYPTYVPGDVTANGIVDLADVVFVVNYLYRGEQSPDPYGRGDVNRDCLIDVADVVYLLGYLFRNGNPPLKGCD